MDKYTLPFLHKLFINPYPDRNRKIETIGAPHEWNTPKNVIPCKDRWCNTIKIAIIDFNADVLSLEILTVSPEKKLTMYNTKIQTTNKDIFYIKSFV